MFASQSLMALKLDQQDILHNIIFNSPCNPFPKQVFQQLYLSDFMMKGCCNCMENRFSRFYSARPSCLLSLTMLSNIWSFAFHSILKESSVKRVTLRYWYEVPFLTQLNYYLSSFQTVHSPLFFRRGRALCVTSIWKSKWPPLTVRRAIFRRSHEKIGHCEQSSSLSLLNI